MASLRGMDVEALLALRGDLDELISSRAGEVEEKISELQGLLKTIKGKG